ncbi:hypothetical protein [Brevibacillus laterosporus]|uniref:hypothetical protein n=1 Tax=Brevibacillus laterosporus TaxID=1465 RepID=UPI000E6B62FF|nr:hypothetical protein [Brevibacillus laterosporus]AYB38549.1 hypothetical protein D5F52_09910 [Brevibacillus laterosporus]MBM7110732.1 hypothetical protein [Brevibacillus laterosporus]
MKKHPLWFKVISIIAIVITIASLITSAPFLRMLSILGLAVIMASLGSFELNKNRTMAFMFFGVAALQVSVLIDWIYVLVAK